MALPRSSARKKRQAQQRRKGVVILLLSITVLGAATGGYVYLQRSRVDIDTATLCPRAGPHAIAAVLIDATDPLSTVQKDYVQKFFDEFSESMPPGTQVSMYSAGAYSARGFEATARLCNPGDGADASRLTANPRRLWQRWHDMFREPLRETVESDMERGLAEQSALFEMLKSLSIDAFPLRDRSVPLELVIVSDMLVNTPDYSHYRDGADFDALKDHSYFAHLFPNLRGVRVRVLYVGRAGMEEIQTRRHAEFWAAYFEFVGASLESIKRI